MPPAQRVRTKMRRGEFPNGGSPWTGRASVSETFKKDLLAYDSEIELHEIHNRIFLYRVTRRGGSRSEDLLVQQFELKWPPGVWLLECLQECDTWKRHGTIQRATEAQLQQYLDLTEEQERLVNRNLGEIWEANKSYLEARFDRQRKLVHLGSP